MHGTLTHISSAWRGTHTTSLRRAFDVTPRRTCNSARGRTSHCDDPEKNITLLEMRRSSHSLSLLFIMLAQNICKWSWVFYISMTARRLWLWLFYFLPTFCSRNHVFCTAHARTHPLWVYDKSRGVTCPSVWSFRSTQSKSCFRCHTSNTNPIHFPLKCTNFTAG